VSIREEQSTNEYLMEFNFVLHKRTIELMRLRSEFYRSQKADRCLTFLEARTIVLQAMHMPVYKPRYSRRKRE